jgi:MFS family permease
VASLVLPWLYRQLRLGAPFRQRPFTLGLLASLVFFSGIPSFFVILLIMLQNGLGYSPVKAGGVTLGFALALAIGSARSAAAVRRLGSRLLVVGCALMLIGQAAVIAVMYWRGTGLAGWQLLLPLFVAGIGGGFFVAPVTNIILAGISAKDAGAASGALATAQQVGAAIGIAAVGVIFFGLIGHNAGASSSSVLPALRTNLTAAGLPAPAQRQVAASPAPRPVRRGTRHRPQGLVSLIVVIRWCSGPTNQPRS